MFKTSTEGKQQNTALLAFSSSKQKGKTTDW